jgi:deoxyadenosine/deoxycytidine kinase
MNYEIQIISIEGNIGSGKSTLLAHLKTHLETNNKIIFLKEPVDEWSKITDEKGTTMLEKFYADQDKYSFPFQMMAYISRLKLLRDTIKNIEEDVQNICWDHVDCKSNVPRNLKYFIITERSLFTDKMVFAKMLYDSGKIEHINYQIYLNWFDTFAEDYKVNKIIYVKTEPHICHERVGKRHRDGEDNIPLEYLNNCDIYHENMLNKLSPDCVCDNQLVIDGNHNITENNALLQEWILSVEKFIYKN